MAVELSRSNLRDILETLTRFPSEALKIARIKLVALEKEGKLEDDERNGDERLSSVTVAGPGV